MSKPTLKIKNIILLCMVVAGVAHAQGAAGFSEVLISANYSEQLKSRLLACSLRLSTGSTDKPRSYEFQLSKSFGFRTSRELLMVELNQDRVTHARAEPNFRGLEASVQALIPTAQFSILNTKNLPYAVALGEWISAMIVRPGRYLEVKIKDAPWESGALDLLREGYSIQASLYDWNGVYPNNFKAKSNLAVGEETLLPFTIKSSGPSPEFDDQVLSAFSYVSDLQMPDGTFHIEVNCR